MSQNASQNAGLNLAMDEVRTLEQLRGQLMRLSNVIDNLQREMIMSGDAPPPWPNMHKGISLINSQLKNIHDFLKDKNDDDQSKGQILSTLRAYPTAPFPAERLQPVLETIMRKKATPEEEKWVEERLRAASEFCRVPAEWNIQPSKAESENEKKGDRDDEFGGVKRIKMDMDEDELTGIWNEAPSIAYEMLTQFTKALAGDYDDGDESGDEDAAALDAIRKEIGLKDTPESTPASTPAAGSATTALPLGTMLKFMSTGATSA